MEIGKVTGTIVATQKDESMKGFKLLVVQVLDPVDLSEKPLRLVAVDIVDAGIGDVVLLVRGSSSRVTTGLKGRPIDASIIGIIDEVVIDGESLFVKGA